MSAQTIESVSHLPFDGSRTYTGRYRVWFYNEHRDRIHGRVLDLGAGSGRDCDQFDGICKADEYIRLDIRPDESLDIVADGTQLPFKPDVFDTVIVSAVLDHIPPSKIPSLLSEVRRVLRKDGVLIAGIPQVYPIHDDPFDFWRPTAYGISDLLTSVGFDDIKCYHGGSWSEMLLHTLFFPLRAIALYLGVGSLAWLFAPVHYFVCAFARIGSWSLTHIYGTNPFGTRWPLQTFVVAA